MYYAPGRFTLDMEQLRLVENGYAALFGVDGSFAAGVYKKLPHLIYKVSY